MAIFIFRKGSKKYVYVSKKRDVLYVLDEAKFTFTDWSNHMLSQNLDLISLSLKDKEELVQKIQKPNSKLTNKCSNNCLY